MIAESSIISTIPDNTPSVIDFNENPTETSSPLVIEQSISVSEPTEHSVLSSSSLTSIDNGIHELSIERKNDDLFQNIPEDPLDML